MNRTQKRMNTGRRGWIPGTDRVARVPWPLTACLPLAVSLMVLGCETTTATRSPFSATVDDPSAQRLHEICEHLLLYYAVNQALPPTLEGLRQVRPESLPPLVSPESGQPYVYHRTPIYLQGRSSRLLIHDPVRAKATIRGEPARWVVLVAEPDPELGGPLATQVVPITESEMEAAFAAAKKSQASQDPSAP